jgi:MOSC domain-containing protein YiiM
VQVTALLTGRSALLPGGKRSAIAKAPVTGRVRIGRLGLEGDVQVNRRHHGGPEMAVHVYPLAHHAFWRDRLGAHPLLEQPGPFGSNIAIADLDEGQVRIGERFRLGSAVLEVSQPRMPCVTIERHFQRQGMVAAILASGRCGWYFRVVVEGAAQAGDALLRVADTGSPLSITTVFSAVAQPASPALPELLAEIGECPLLAAEWREKARAKLARQTR